MWDDIKAAISLVYSDPMGQSFTKFHQWCIPNLSDCDQDVCGLQSYLHTSKTWENNSFLFKIRGNIVLVIIRFKNLIISTLRRSLQQVYRLQDQSTDHTRNNWNPLHPQNFGMPLQLLLSLSNCCEDDATILRYKSVESFCQLTLTKEFLIRIY